MRNLLVFSMDLPSNSVYHQVLTESIFIPRKKAISFQKASTKPTTFSHFFTEAYLEFIIQVKHKFNVFYFPLDPKLLQSITYFSKESHLENIFFSNKAFLSTCFNAKMSVVLPEVFFRKGGPKILKKFPRKHSIWKKIGTIALASF